MADPITLVVFGTAAATTVFGGAGQRLGERIIDRVWPERGSEGPARQTAVENAEAMYNRLQGRLDDLQKRIGSGHATEQAVLEALKDPDFSFTVHQALLGGARTSNGARHEVLARAVVERIVAAPDSTQAVASTLAVEAVGRLSGPQMDALGLLALLYYVAPVHHAPGPLEEARLELPEDADRAREIRRAAWQGERATAQQLVSGYVSWLEEALKAHGLAEGVTPLDYAHLVSASCTTFDRGLRRELDKILEGRDLESNFEGALRGAYDRELGRAFGSRHQPGPLRLAWESGLQHVTLTPAGILIGAIVHELRTGEHVDVRWEVGAVDLYRDERAWDGRELNRDFYKKLKGELERDWAQIKRAGGHPPWDS